MPASRHGSLFPPETLTGPLTVRIIHKKMKEHHAARAHQNPKQKALIPPRHRKPLPDDSCGACGTLMVEKRGKLRLPVNGEAMPVPSAVHMSCPKCHDIVLRFRDPRRLGEDAIAIYRRKHGLLSGDQIRAIRQRFELTRAGFAGLLRLGTNTLTRWESGGNVQTEAMDVLLRLIRDVPGASITYVVTAHRVVAVRSRSPRMQPRQERLE